ncbi:MAG: Hsp20/alpha crystallin family protein [Rhodoferax sp.]
MTRFKPGEKSELPVQADIDDDAWLPGLSWAMLGGDVFEDDKRVVVRIEAPGMRKSDFNIEVIGDELVVRGEKRFERESSEGRWRVLQCAYGSFHRSVPLPAAVLPEQAKAGYRDGVLRVEMPKARSGRPQVRQIRVN